VVFGAGDAFSTGKEIMIIREQRVGLRWTSAYKKQLPVLLEAAIAGRLFLTARLHLTISEMQRVCIHSAIFSN